MNRSNGKTRRKIYEGKAKILYEGPEPCTLIQYFKDDATAFNAQKKASVQGKGVINNRISERLMTLLSDLAIPNHFIRRLNMREQLIREVDIIPLELIVRNRAAGTLCKRLGLPEGEKLSRPLVEFCLKDDKLGDPLVSEEQILVFKWANNHELEDMVQSALRVNDILSGLFSGIGLILVDFKLEYGRSLREDGLFDVLLADEISPDTARLWDADSLKKLDKDRFREDLGGVVEAYQEVASRLGVLPRNSASGASGPTLVNLKQV